LIGFFALALSAGTGLAQTPDATAVVRLSYSQGQVRVLQGNATLFDQAQANMPLLAGYALSTGQDGQAEVEFTDGSVARVTPNSELRLDRLPGADTREEATEITMVSGLGYFELNTANGQHFRVHFSAAEARPVSNSIFRINLDNVPDLAVFLGTVRVSASGAFDQTIEEGGSLHFDANDTSNVATAAITSDSWDQWNQERDNQIAQQAQQQTAARETSGATNEPGWDDLDAYGDWYPVEGYGNVWVPGNEPEGWDPYSNGYWANYPSWGYTWISGYPWGWLPYHCGAWNYWNSFGWGWVPGQCGLGWQPIVTFWNTPPGWRPPPRPIPGGHIGPPSRLLAVSRGPALPNRGINNHHTQPVRIEGQRVDPLPVLENRSVESGRLSFRGTGGPAPVTHGSGFVGNSGRLPTVQMGHAPLETPPTEVLPPRAVYRPTVPMMPVPQPRLTPSVPRYAPPPTPHMSAPPPHPSSPPPASASHFGGGSPAGHH
jgi:hypothetical protein